MAAIGEPPVEEPASVPQFTVSSTVVGAAQGLASFGEAVGDVFAIDCVGEPGDYAIDMAAWHLGTMMTGTFRSSALRFSRSRALVGQSGLDHILVQLYVAGGFAGDADGRDVLVQPGNVVIFDLSRPFHTQTTDFTNISLLVPRAHFEAVFDEPLGLHGLVLSQDRHMVAILAAYLQALAERMPHLLPKDARAAAVATAGLTTTVLQEYADSPAVGTPVVSPFRAAARHIDDRIHDPDLDVATLAQELAVSRATLYRVFEPVGGVASYIRRRRLTGAAMALADPANRRRTAAEIGYAWGFTSETAFNRTFKAAFGLTPHIARQRGDHVWAADGEADETAEQRFVRWMRLLRP